MSLRRCAAALLLGMAMGSAVAAAPPVQLDPGSIITVAIVEPGGEYDGFREIVGNDARGMTLALKWTAGTGEGKAARANQRVLRFVDRQDLEEARKIRPFFSESDAESFPGATAVQTSRRVLEELKTKGETSIVFGYLDPTPADGLPFDMSTLRYLRGKLERQADAPFAVVLDGVRTMLPAVRAAGRLALGGVGQDFDFVWLDDPANAMTLQWRTGGHKVQVVRIDRPRPEAHAGGKAGGAIESALAGKSCRAEAQGLYFNTGSATLLEDSNRTLAALAALMQKHADWTLTVEGHTDHIGGAAFNLDLSKRRADAVVTALVARGVATKRLQSQGFGLTRPKESNDSVAGRAANRRVEIARACAP